MRCLEFLLPIKLGEAEIKVASSTDAGKLLRVSFILRTFELVKKNDFAKISVPGLNGQPLQFMRGHARKLSTVLYFGGRGTNMDVRRAMQDVADLMNVDRQSSAPPVLSFEWKEFSMRCVLERFREEFSLLSSDGRPSRGTMHVTFRESRTLQDLQYEVSRE
jgi:hypothetical protein